MAVTNPILIRRAFRGRLRFVVPIIVVTSLLHGSPPTLGGEPALSPNPLDRPMADLAILASPDPEAIPLLLIVDADSRSPSVARLALLRREAAWVPVTSTEIDLGADDLTARWLVRLDVDRFALVATSPQSASGTGHGMVVGLAVDEQAGAVRIEEHNRQTFGRAIEDAGAADVDGFGSVELVLGMRPSDSIDSCGTSTLVVVDGSIAAVRRSIDIPGPRGAGVLGRFDAAPGADLLIYTSPGCPPGGSFESSLLAIRLADGSQSRPVGMVSHDFVTTLPPPLLVDVDGSAPDEVIATGASGLAVFDPSRAWRSLVVADIGAIPLMAGPTGRSGHRGVGVAIFDAPRGRPATARLRRDEGDLVWSSQSELAIDPMDPARGSILSSAIETAGTHQAAPNAWIGDALDMGCADVLLPGAILECASDDLRTGPAWLATRPIAALQIGGRRSILVAAGLDWRPEVGLPASPTPAATGLAGWWRHGPSAPFALSEVSSDDLLDLEAIPPPAATIESTSSADGTVALAGRAGTRFFATIAPLAGGHERRLPPTDALLALTTRPVQGGQRAVVRVAAPAGGDRGDPASPATVAIRDLRPSGDQPASGWAMRVVPFNDLGEWGRPVSGTITYDDSAPTVVVEEPFTSPIWPFSAEIEGRSEAGTTVRVDGIGEVEVDPRGGFTIGTQLAPWPQSFRVTATDSAGNQTAGTFSVVGGVDYRRFPWPTILAVGLFALVAARGWFGGGSVGAERTSAPRSAWGLPDEDLAMPVIEELPAGSGLARR